ncbi:MAG: hypothetical protein K2L98_04385, partial [Bacilli bacterium]|nr:hypothetical protein [Bacilli bacterium]
MDWMRPDSYFIADFYNNDGKFNGFLNISYEEMELLIKQAAEIKAYLKPRHLAYARGYGVYMDTIKHLVTLENNGEITCDQKMFLFINLMDPKLEIYDVYMKNPKYSQEEIDNAPNKIRQNNMYQDNYRSQRKIEYMLKLILACCDEKLIQYEIAYKRNVVCRNKINTEVYRDLTKEILKMAEELSDLDDITNERFQELVSISKKLKEDVSHLSLPVLTNALLYQTDLLGISTATEQVLLFLLVLDFDLHLIDIYEEESLYQEIERRALKAV